MGATDVPPYAFSPDVKIDTVPELDPTTVIGGPGAVVDKLGRHSLADDGGSIYRDLLERTRQGLKPVVSPPGVAEVEATAVIPTVADESLPEATSGDVDQTELPLSDDTATTDAQTSNDTVEGQKHDNLRDNVLAELQNLPDNIWGRTPGKQQPIDAPASVENAAPPEDMLSPGYVVALSNANKSLVSSDDEDILQRLLDGLNNTLSSPPIPAIEPERNPYDELSKLRESRLAALRVAAAERTDASDTGADTPDALPTTSEVRASAQVETTRIPYPEPIDIVREGSVRRLREEATKGPDGKPRWDGPRLGLGTLAVKTVGALMSESAYRQQVYPTRTTPFPERTEQITFAA